GCGSGSVGWWVLTIVMSDGVGKSSVAEQDGSSVGSHCVFSPGSITEVLITSPPGQSERTVACTVKVTDPPVTISTWALMGPEPEVGVTVDSPAGAGVAVQVMPVSAGESNGSLMVARARVACAALLLVLVTVTV